MFGIVNQFVIVFSSTQLLACLEIFVLGNKTHRQQYLRCQSLIWIFGKHGIDELSKFWGDLFVSWESD